MSSCPKNPHALPPQIGTNGSFLMKCAFYSLSRSTRMIKIYTFTRLRNEGRSLCKNHADYTVVSLTGCHLSVEKEFPLQTVSQTDVDSIFYTTADYTPEMQWCAAWIGPHKSLNRARKLTLLNNRKST